MLVSSSLETIVLMYTYTSGVTWSLTCIAEGLVVGDFKVVVALSKGLPGGQIGGGRAKRAGCSGCSRGGGSRSGRGGGRGRSRGRLCGPLADKMVLRAAHSIAPGPVVTLKHRVVIHSHALLGSCIAPVGLRVVFPVGGW